MNDVYASDEDEIQRDPELTPAQKANGVQRIKELAAAWRPRHRRIYLRGLVDSSGQTVTEPSECAKQLAEYWGEVSKFVPSQVSEFGSLDQFIQPVPSGTQWVL
eukprot:4194995-Pyramimonas_sp.AAC.1